MILTAHARKRLGERFPGVEGVRLLEEWEYAKEHRATPTQMRLIRMYSRCTDDRVHRFLVSRIGIVFVAGQDEYGEYEIVVTVFILPTERPTWTDGERRVLRVPPIARRGARRPKERPWHRGDDPYD